ncbi:DUF4421 family protein [Pseudotamlana agarivorans]|uniref:DUF4421 family protein n=1 Tax=Pseudotamlana agarivorans TaxID=481183 RepID=UPI0014720EAB|nr:DUF4421 family protein [Tamlana agarivorans]
MKLKPIYLLLSLLSTSLFAQNEPQNAVNDSLQEIIYGVQNNDYIYIYKNRVTARAFFIKTSNPLTIRGRGDESHIQYQLNPNKQDKIGASVAFRSISASYSFSPNALAENPDDKDSKVVNFNFRNYFGKHWMQTLDIYSQKGFHLKDQDNHQVYLPKTKSFKIGGTTSYIFNENFSYRARASQNEKQLKSAGTFMPNLVYYYTKHNLRAYNEATGASVDTEYRAFDIALAPSYLYNFVPTKNLFISAGVSAGIGANFSKNSDDDENLVSLLTELDFSGTITYDIKQLYLGAQYNYLILNYNSDASSYVKDNIPFMQFFVGYRFKASRKMVNKADSVNKKLHFN